MSKNASSSNTAVAEIGRSLYDDNMPDTSPHAIAAERAEEVEPIKDKSGTTFDPEAHAVDGEGKPRYTATGQFAKKRGRKQGSAKNSTVGAAAQGPSSNDKFRMTGTAIAESIFMAGRVLGGDDWAPIKDETLGLDERANMTDAWTEYAKHKNMSDVPPGVLVTIVMLGYVGPRLAKPATKTRLSMAWVWIKSKLKGRKNGARSNTGNDGKREDDASETTSK